MRIVAGILALMVGMGAAQANCDIAPVATLKFKTGSLMLEKNSKSALKTARAAAPVIKRYLVKTFDDGLNAKRGILVAYRLKQSGAEKVHIERTKEQKPGTVGIIALGPECKIPGSSGAASEKQTRKVSKAGSFSWKKDERLSDVIARWSNKPVVVERFDRQLLVAGVYQAQDERTAAKWLAEHSGCQIKQTEKEAILSCGK